MRIRPISISLSPNIQRDDIIVSLKALFGFWKWKKGKEIALFEEEFKKYTGLNYTLSCNSGRTALFLILKALQLKEGDEVLVQSFTCNAAINPILWNSLKPVFIDVNEDDFNINPSDLEKKITPKSKVLIVQHTFGLPANMEEIKKIAKNLIIIEDCAHSLGSKYKGKLTGNFSDVAFFSFSRDKIISSVYGGMIATNNKSFIKKIERLEFPSNCFILQQIIHPLILSILLPIYNPIGKILLIAFQKVKILSKAVHNKEKRGEMPSYFPKRMPNALAIMALNQLKKIDKLNKHRRSVANIYYKELKESGFLLPKSFEDRESSFLRFSLKNKEAHDIIKNAWRKNILIGDWYTSVIAPSDTNLQKMGYTGDCVVSEKLSMETFNLPTHINISEKEIKEVINFLKEWK